MATRRRVWASAVLGITLVALALRATSVHSVGPDPEIFRATVVVNDLESVRGMGIPGRFVELRARQRNFIEGEDGTGDPFQWCKWKNGGQDFHVGTVQVDANGLWELTNLRTSGTTVSVLPAGPAEDRCLGGLYTELLVRSCVLPGIGCSTSHVPTLHWMNVRRIAGPQGVTTAAVSDAWQAAASVADGPNDEQSTTGIVDADQDGIDTTKEGFTVGQRVVWRCGAGGTLSCPSVSVYDGTTAMLTDPEFPYVLGTVQAHRGGGSIIAAAAIPRGAPVGFTVNVNVKFRGIIDAHLGCDQPKFFDFM